MTEFLSPQQDALRHLERVSAILNNMQVAALTIRALRQPKMPRKALHMLDADVVCGALRTFAVGSALAKHSEVKGSPDEAFVELNQLVGPHTLRYVVNQVTVRGPAMGDNLAFTLPSGARYELLVKKSQVLTLASKKSEAIIAKFNRAFEQSRPLQTMRTDGTWRQLKEATERELTDIDDLYGDAETLNQVLRNATPIESIAGEGSEESERACLTAYSLLRQYRRSASTQNKADAVNVGQLALILDRPHSAEGADLLPFLITETKAVSRLEQLFPTSDRRRNDLPSDVRFFHNHVLLLLESTFARLYGDHPLVVRNAAGRLCAILQKMTNVLEELIDRVARHGELSGPEWDVFRQAFWRFDNEFGALIKPLELVAEQDAISVKNELLSASFASLLRKVEGDRRLRLEDLHVQLRERLIGMDAERGLGVLMQRLEHGVAADEEGPRSRPPELAVAELFQLCIAPDHFGVPIAELDRSSALEELSPSTRLTLVRPTRIVVRPKFFTSGRVPMVVDCWQIDGELSVSVAWPSGANRAKAESSMLQFLRSAWKNAQAVQIVRFPTDLELAKGRFAKLEELQRVLTVSCEPPTESIEATLGNVTVFTDFEPVDNVDRQFGVVAPFVEWEGDLLRHVVELISGTNPVYEMGDFTKEIVTAVLNAVG